MEYEEVADFRSELQYRLALALDLEDEEDEHQISFSSCIAIERTCRNSPAKRLHSSSSSHGDHTADSGTN